MGLNGGGSSNWGSRKEQKYQSQGTQNGYAMAYGGTECYTHGMSKPQNAYGMAETWDEYGQSYGNYNSQNGPAMSKTQLHAPGKREGRVYGYGGPIPAARFQRNGTGMGHGFGNHGNYEITEAHGYEETNGYAEYDNHGMGNGYREYGNNGMGRSQPQLRGKHSGHGNGFVNTQSYGPAKTMGFEYTEAEYFSNQSQYYGGGGRRHHAGNAHSAKGLIRNNSGNNSCSDSDSDDDNDKGWNSKAI
ncbi:hypothetical protein HRI_003223900 [Hibiscus trionum]|uniref:Uncharacterized protein n=1 Tax=Hibiscus trionum TaxID=183268 RepID=A0A9W7II64_HIBTR|nr:hypothetical protein HRI_003223900 [Hibiscus trionum]